MKGTALLVLFTDGSVDLIGRNHHLGLHQNVDFETITTVPSDNHADITFCTQTQYMLFGRIQFVYCVTIVQNNLYALNRC